MISRPDSLAAGLDLRVREVGSRHVAGWSARPCRRSGPVPGGDASQTVPDGVPAYLDSGPRRATGHVACGERWSGNLKGEGG